MLCNVVYGWQLKGKEVHFATKRTWQVLTMCTKVSYMATGNYCVAFLISLIFTPSDSLVDSLFFSFHHIPIPSAIAPAISNRTATPTGTAIATASSAVSDPVNDQWRTMNRTY